MHRDRDVVAHGFQPPDELIEILTAENLIRVPRQKQQQLVLLIGQRQLLAVHCGRVRLGIDPERACLHDRGLGRLRFEPAVLRQIRFDPRDQYAGEKRFFDVIICAEAETADLVHVIRARRHHQDRHIQLLAQPLADGNPIHARQHQIQQNEVIFTRERRVQPAQAVIRCLDLHPVELQISALNFRDLMVVFNDQDLTHAQLLSSA